MFQLQKLHGVNVQLIIFGDTITCWEEERTQLNLTEHDFNTPQFVIKTQPHAYKMRWQADVIVYHRVSRRFNNTVALLSQQHKSLTFKENCITL